MQQLGKSNYHQVFAEISHTSKYIQQQKALSQIRISKLKEDNQVVSIGEEDRQEQLSRQR